MPALAGVAVAAYLAFPRAAFWDPGWAVLLGNTVFVTGVSLVVAYLAFRTFSANGRLQLLLLGGGVLTFGAAAGAAAVARGLADGANLNVTIYNLGALLAAAFHAAAVFLLVSGSARQVGAPRRPAWLVAALAGPVASVALLAAACAWGIVPPFFVQGAGPTPLRQGVLGAAAVLFLFSSVASGATYLRTRERFLYWYAGGLALTAVSLGAILVQRAVGSPVGWAGRISQYVGGLYFLAAIANAAGAALLRRTSFENVLTSSLSGAEETFRALAENAPDVIRRFDRDLNHIYVNLAGQRLYGMTASALIGRGVAVTGLAGAQARAWDDRLRRVFQSRAPEQVEEYLETPGGRRFHQSLCVPEFGADGAVANVLVLSRDLTDRRRAEERTRRQNAVLDGIARIFRETLGAETAQELGRTCLDVVQELTGSAFGFLAELDPETGRLEDVAISDPGWAACRMSRGCGHSRKLPAGAVAGLHGRVLAEGRSLVANDPATHPDRAGAPAGHPAIEAFLGVPLQRAGRTVGVIGLANRPGGYRDEDREVAELLAPAVVQALDRKRAQDALRASEERFRHAASLAQALNAIAQLVHSTLDLDELIRRALTEAVAALGASTAAVSMREGKSWVVRYVHGLPPGAVGAVMRDDEERHAVLAIERREPVAVSDALHDDRVNRAHLSAWGIRSVLVVPLVVKDEPIGVCFLNWQGTPAELGAVHLDFAVKLGSSMSLAMENARLVADLRDAARRKDDFLGVLSHELRNPLAPIRNSVFVLERTPAGSDAARRAKEVIRRQVEHLTRLVDDLLDVTRISRGKIELHRHRVDLGELVRRACDDHGGLFLQHGLTLELTAGDAVWVDGDDTRLLQVMDNLLQNAARFGRERGTVAVQVGREQGAAHLRVRDDGIGIGPEFLPHVFEPFVQEGSERARSRGGLGVGLALVKGLVELHGGTVSARSDGAGRGAEFVVTLPLAAAPAAQAERVPPDHRAPGQQILVVDDHPDEAASLRDALELAGHDVAVAHDGAEALEQVRALRPAAVLCDIGLPKMNGFDVARAIRRDPSLAAVRLVALTGYARPEDVRAALEAGFDHHIAKPARIPDIERALCAPGAPPPARLAPVPAPAPARPAAQRPQPPLAQRPGLLPARSPALEDFLSRVFHDLRAPFRDVEKGCKDLLAAGGDAGGLGEPGRRHLDVIRSAVARAQALVEDLQTLWRVANTEPVPTELDLTAMAREIAARLHRTDPARRVVFEIEEGLRAEGDARLLRTVLENLLGNAWKYSAPRPEAHIALGRADTPAGEAFFVRDDGVGFDPTYTGTLFEPFQRLHGQSEFEGTGLGLHIVRRAVERHGGRAWIASAPGSGTVAHFTLG